MAQRHQDAAYSDAHETAFWYCEPASDGEVGSRPPSCDLSFKHSPPEFDDAIPHHDTHMRGEYRARAVDVEAFLSPGATTDDGTPVNANADSEMHDPDVYALLNEPCCWPLACAELCYDVPMHGNDGRGNTPSTPPPLPLLTPPATMALPEPWRLPPAGPVPSSSPLGAPSVSERLHTCMQTNPQYPITTAVPRFSMPLAAQLPSARGIPAYRPEVHTPQDALRVCAQSAPGHLDHMHVRSSGGHSSFRQARAPVFDLQASRASSVVNFSIDLDTFGALPSAFESAAAAALFQAPLAHTTPFAEAPSDMTDHATSAAAGVPAFYLPEDEGVAGARTHARIASMYAIVTAEFDRPLVSLPPVATQLQRAGGLQLGMGFGDEAPAWLDALPEVVLPLSDVGHRDGHHGASSFG